jgi:fibronectin type 3 domain-containing protein
LAGALSLVACDEESTNKPNPSDSDSLTFDVVPMGPGKAKLAWDPNSESDLAGYRLHIGTESRTYDRQIDVGNDTTYTVDELQPGQTYYFAVTAHNTAGAESDYSNEVDYTEPSS